MRPHTAEYESTDIESHVTRLEEIRSLKAPHAWLHGIHVYADITTQDPRIESVSKKLLDAFRAQEHQVQDDPGKQTDLLITSATFGVPLDWRQAPLFNMRRRLGVDHAPPVLCILHATHADLKTQLDILKDALAKRPPDPADFQFPGLAPTAYRVLIEQGLRGGPILALERVLQSQAKSIRILLIVGDETPEYAYLFDLVGAHPRIAYEPKTEFYNQIVRRLVTAACSQEVTNHRIAEGLISAADWRSSDVPAAMRRASLELGERNFFTAMVRIADLVQVPALDDAIADQYSEGCFATWDVHLGALITTVTGSARPVDKGNLTDDDLSVIVGVQADGSGAVVRHVAGKQNDSPSSEAVEMIDMDGRLPRIQLDSDWPIQGEVPVIRSKLHGHRSVGSYNPDYVEHVYLDAPYYHYPVSCSTDSQARAIKTAFARSEALTNPSDPRRLVFTVLPGHGIMIAEKWVPNKAPLQTIWEYFDAGLVEIVKEIPQGPLAYAPDPDGRMILHTA